MRAGKLPAVLAGGACAVALFLTLRIVANRPEGLLRPTVKVLFVAADTGTAVQPLGVSARWMDASGTGNSLARWEECTMRPDGSLALPDAPAGHHALCLSARVPREYLEVGDFVADVGASLEIPLRRGGSIEGHVVGGEDGEVPSSVEVLAVWDATSQWDHGLESTTLGSGRAFRLERVPQETDIRVFLSGGRAGGRGKPVVTRVGSGPVVLEVSSALRLAGRVVDASCCPGWRVEACREGVPAAMFARWGEAEIRQDGSFAIPNLPAGEYRLVVLDAEGMLRAVSEPLAAGAEPVTIQAPVLAMLKGYVEGVPPRWEAAVQISTSYCWSKEFHTDGSYFDISLPVGLKYDVRVSCDKGLYIRRHLLPPENLGPIILTPEVSLVGRVRGITGSTHVIVKQAGVEQSTWTCGGARFTFGSLLPEECEVLVLSKPAFYALALSTLGSSWPSDDRAPLTVSVKPGGEEVTIDAP